MNDILLWRFAGRVEEELNWGDKIGNRVTVGDTIIVQIMSQELKAERKRKEEERKETLRKELDK